MSTALTIRNLDPEVKRKLRHRAAQHQTSMEAEARAILAMGVERGDDSPPRTVQEMSARLAGLVGTWKARGAGQSTDQIMEELRGDE